VADDARAAWEARHGRRHEGAPAPSLPPPDDVRAESGAGHATLRWSPVPGAVGYVVARAGSPDGPWEPVDHGGRDVLAVPGPWYCDTTGERGRAAWYAVSSIASAESDPGERSRAVEATPGTGPAAPLTLRVEPSAPAGRLYPVWRMLGSEHVSQLDYEERTGGRVIGEDVEEAYRLAVAELGAERVRAHAILHDELGVYREQDGRPVYDFSRIESLYERLLGLGLRPVVELSFMPRDLARDPGAWVFEYRGLISPPKDWDRWADLNRRLAAALVGRFGVDEVARWGFEVWNEANLEVFWTGTRDEYFRLYETAARAIKSVDERLPVGGPSTAAAGWVTAFLDFVVDEAVPLDFLSTHTYGNLPLDVREAARARGLAVEVWWTEWGVTPTHFYSVTDSPFAAPFVLHGMKAVQGRAEALAYWVVSDHFEELGRPPSLVHGGFGLLTVGNLRKPRWWALHLAERLGNHLVEARLEGDGAGSLVDCWATRSPDGTVQVLLWNGTLDQSKLSGDPLLDRVVSIEVRGAGDVEGSLARVDLTHSRIDWPAQRDWPADEREWERLRAGDALWEERVSPDRDGRYVVALPMPGVVRLRLTPRG
jgi:xylan 1,4-beta-xylosidase